MFHMKSTRFLALAALAMPLIAHAHPGHDGDHDLVWDFDHLSAHPWATLLCFGLIAAVFWGITQLVASRRARAEIRRRSD